MKWFIFSVLALSIAAPLAQADGSLPMRFVKVSDSIYRGARPSVENLRTIAQMGIKTDIDLQGGDLINFKYRELVKKFEPGELPQAIAAENQEALAAGLRFINTPLDSLDPVDSGEDQAIDGLLALLNQATPEQPLFVHCEHGQDRTGLVIALYRIEHDGWTPDAAYKEWEAFGHDELHQIFTDDLDTYFAQKSKALVSRSPISL